MSPRSRASDGRGRSSVTGPVVSTCSSSKSHRRRSTMQRAHPPRAAEVPRRGDARQLMTQAAATVHELTGFDRVMAYRFDGDWNGEVIAEITEPGRPEFLGLRFPASDIPPQARALYSRARLRLIPDAVASPSPLLAIDGASGGALDLSDVSIRAVSPVHLQYLRNMGVAASMSVAIHVGDRLWGLIACHHFAGPLAPSLRLRQAVDLVGQTTSTMLAALLEAESAVAQVACSEGRRGERGDHAEGTRILEMLLVAMGPLPGDARRDRCCRRAGSAVLRVGRCPPATRDESRRARRDRGLTRELHRESCRLIDPAWAAHTQTAAGAVVVPIEADSTMADLVPRRDARDRALGRGPDARRASPEPSTGGSRSTPSRRSTSTCSRSRVEARRGPRKSSPGARSLAHRSRAGTTRRGAPQHRGLGADTAHGHAGSISRPFPG